MTHRGSPFLGPRESLAAFTFVGPRPILVRLREVSERLGISRHVLAALALDEYLSQHYPNAGASEGGQTEAHMVMERATQVNPREHSSTGAC